MCPKSKRNLISRPRNSIHGALESITPANFSQFLGLWLVLDDLVRVVILLQLRIGIVVGNGSGGLGLSFATLLCAATLGGSSLGDTRGLLRGAGAVLPTHLDGKQTEALLGRLGGDAKLLRNSVELLTREEG